MTKRITYCGLHAIWNNHLSYILRQPSSHTPWHVRVCWQEEGGGNRARMKHETDNVLSGYSISRNNYTKRLELTMRIMSLALCYYSTISSIALIIVANNCFGMGLWRQYGDIKQCHILFFFRSGISRIQKRGDFKFFYLCN